MDLEARENKMFKDEIIKIEATFSKYDKNHIHISHEFHFKSLYEYNEEHHMEQRPLCVTEVFVTRKGVPEKYILNELEKKKEFILEKTSYESNVKIPSCYRDLRDNDFFMNVADEINNICMGYKK